MAARKMLAPIFFILAAGVVLIFWAIGSYNSLVSAKEGVNAAWAQVETNYQRRADLIPNLVSTVQGAADFEQETFTEVTAARSQWQQAGSRDQRIEAAGALDGALSRLLVTVESYPQLQATQAFRDLMTQLEGTENRIATSRRDFNESVRSYNLLVKQFPSVVFARMFGFSEEEFFEAAEGSDVAPVVDFE